MTHSLLTSFMDSGGDCVYGCRVLSLGRGAVFVAALAATMSPAVASAATFSQDYGDGSYILRYTAVAGETNHLTLTSAGAGFTAADTSALVTAGPTCAQVDAHTVTCPGHDDAMPFDFFVTRIEVTLGDGADTAVVTARCEGVPFGARCRHLDGGTGNDQLTGGDDDDRFVGRDGDGSDVYTGGGGDDLADYSAATTAVDVTLDGVADDGPVGQQDLVPAGLGVLGGTAGDTLVGSNGPDRLDGNGGTDAVTGAGGDDHLRATVGADTVSGGPGDDTLVAEFTTAAVLSGGDGDDMIEATLNAATASVDGGADDDVIRGGGLIQGGAGDDVLHAHGGGTLDGGPGDDVLDDNEPAGIAQRLQGGPGVDTAQWTGARNEGISASTDDVANDGGPPICGTCEPEGDNVGSDVERLVGTTSDDTLTGGAGDQVLRGGFGADHLAGGPGSDVADYTDHTAAVAVSLDAVANDADGDVIATDIEGVTGGAGADRLVGNAGSGRFDGGPGDDVVRGGNGADAMSGGPGEDTVDYGDHAAGVEVSVGSGADDGNADDADGGVRDDVRSDIERVMGSPGDDGLAGGSVLEGGGGDDVLDGGEGDDALVGGAGDDDLHGGPGRDLADYAAEPGPVLVTLDAVADDGPDTEADLVTPDVEDVRGGAGDDVLIGSDTANALRGGDGDDLLDGGAGPDDLDGGAGADVADYGGRTTSVAVTLLGGTRDDGGVEDGPAGSRDDVSAVEAVIGGAGNDTLVGDGLDNVFDGGRGADELSGGGGFDAVDYVDRSEGVTVDLAGAGPSAGGPSDGPPGARDRLTDIEDVYGGSGADVLHGSTSENVFLGRGGDDLLDLRDGGGEDFAHCDTGSDVAHGDPGDELHPTCEQRNPPPPTGPGAPPPTPTPSTPPTAPALSLRAPRRSTLDRRGRLTVRIVSDRDAVARVVATFRIAGIKRRVRVRALDVRLTAGSETPVRLRLRASDARRIRHALKRRKSVTVRVDVTVPGTVAEAHRTLRLRLRSSKRRP